jgi:PrgI family protein
MAEYKVPQDVEADDKLIGPFSFRQFVYLIIVVLAGAMAWGLWQLFPPLAIIPLPIIVFFGALALPLRKDQPMEIYLAAMVSFYLKPRKRLWEADGIESLIEITVPKVAEVQRTKNLSQGEAQERFGYLATIVDSQGWAVRGQGTQAPNGMTTDAYLEAQQVEDILDSGNNVAQSLDYMIDKSDERRHQEVMDRIRAQAAAAPAEPVTTTVPAAFNFFAGQDSPGTPPAPVVQPAPYAPDDTTVTSGPIASYQPAQTDPPTTSEKDIPAGIIDLATNADLSIATIAHEANRINQENDMNEEVVISLR